MNQKDQIIMLRVTITASTMRSRTDELIIADECCDNNLSYHGKVKNEFKFTQENIIIKGNRVVVSESTRWHIDKKKVFTAE